MTYTAVDCMGFAGGFTLGVVQAGFTLVAKREERGGFGARNCLANRHLLGDTWDFQAANPVEWTVPAVKPELVFGNPPCSGFSVLTVKERRGVDSKVNQCMWHFVEYAARCAPQVVIFESVQPALGQGRSLMLALRARLEELTNDRWTLHHVLHNALSVGGPAMRRRYFWVASRVPFGVEEPVVTRVPLLPDVIGDLQTLDQRWDAQPYWIEPSWYSRQFRNVSGYVDGHISLDNPHTRRARELLDAVEWHPGEYTQQVTRRYFDIHGALPPGWEHLTDKLKGQDFFQGYNTATMWRPTAHARVITGAGMLNGIHWAERRTFTHREVARIMGFPDDWLIEPLRQVPGLFMTWGKGITVHCGRWITNWVRSALDGTPGTLVGELIGDREYLVDVTNSWQMTCGTVNTARKFINLSNSLSEGNILVTETAIEATETVDGRRGRPRPNETLERDERVYEALTESLTKTQLAERVGMSPTITYLSLYRLRAAGRVTRAHVDGAHRWSRVEGAA